MISMRIVVVLLLLLVMAAGLGAWAYTSRGYQNAVYYDIMLVRPSAGSGDPVLSYEEWIDPVRSSARFVIRQGTAPSPQIIRSGVQYWAENGGPMTGHPLDRASLSSLARRYGLLRRGGWQAIADQLRAQAIGPIARVRYAGRPALRFATADHSQDGDHPLQTIVWIDAATNLELAYQTRYSSGVVLTTLSDQRRIPPNSLPATFFDPPGTSHSPWERAIGWLRDRVAGR